MPEAPVETPRYVIEEPLTGQIIGGNGADATEPESEPWHMTRLAYQESRAMRVAGGVSILNAKDGREHEAAVRRAAAEGLPVPPRVLAEYGLAEEVHPSGRTAATTSETLQLALFPSP